VNSTWPEYVQLDTGGSFTRGDSTNEPIAESKDADDYLGPIVSGRSARSVRSWYHCDRRNPIDKAIDTMSEQEWTAERNGTKGAVPAAESDNGREQRQWGKEPMRRAGSRPCANCGKGFEPSVYTSHNQKYCSYRCRKEAKRRTAMALRAAKRNLADGGVTSSPSDALIQNAEDSPPSRLISQKI
jgi:hypothetical protein